MAASEEVNGAWNGHAARKRVVGTVIRVGVPVLFLLTLIGCIVWFFAGPQEPTPDQIARLGSGVRNLLVFAAVMGVVGMAFVEMGKRMLLLRGAYHARCIRELLGPNVLVALVHPLRLDAKVMHDRGFMQPSDDEPTRRRLDIPLEQLSAQIGDVGEALLLRLAAEGSEPGPTPETTKAGVSRPITSISRDFDVKMARDLCGQRGEMLLKRLSEGMPDEVDRAVTELRTLVFAALDRFQIVVGGRWRAGVQLAAASTTAALTVPAVALMNVGPVTKTVAVCMAFVVGGVVSWVARDVVAVIEKLRER